MGFTEDTRIDGTREVTFLYKLEKGLVKDSFGVECARLGGVSEKVLIEAGRKAAEMKGEVEGRIVGNKFRRCVSILQRASSHASQTERDEDQIEELRSVLLSI